jgi:hypothetical protein
MPTLLCCAVLCYAALCCAVQFTSVDDSSHDVTPEEMEAYRLKKSRGGDDPMKAFKANGDKGTDGYDLL